MKNSTSPARALAALISGWSSFAALLAALESGEVAFIGRQNSNAPRRCHAVSPPIGPALPSELPAKDHIHAAAGPAIERLSEIVLQKDHAVGLEVARPVAASLDQAAMVG